MSSLFSGYASFFTESSSRFLMSTTQSLNKNLLAADSPKILNLSAVTSSVTSDHTFDLLKKFLAYSVLSTVVASSAFYVGYNYAKQRNRFDPRSREDDKTDQVKFKDSLNLYKFQIAY